MCGIILAKGAVVVCDVSRADTVQSVLDWKRAIDEWACDYEVNDHRNKLLQKNSAMLKPHCSYGNRRGIPVVLIANKCDLLTDAVESFRLGAELSRVCAEVKS